MSSGSPLKLLPFAGVTRPPRRSLASAHSPRHQLELAAGRSQLLPVPVFTADPAIFIDGPKPAEILVHGG